MRQLLERRFQALYDDACASLSGLELVRCNFESCCLSMTTSPKKRTRVRDCVIRSCEQRGCTIEAALVERVRVEDLKSHGLLQCWAAAFREVLFLGSMGRLMISAAVKSGMASPEVQREFDAANREFYRHTSWAIDIRQAEFTECDIQGVPAGLILRDPETQVVVTREAALRGEWRDLDLSGTHWAAALQLFLDRRDQDVVLVAGKKARNHKALVEGLELLKHRGIAT